MVDLHTHTVYSDGTYTPTQLIEEAEAIGLSALALCDHDTAQGIPEFLAAAKGKKVIPVPAAELSACFEGGPLHVIAMFLPPDQYGAVDAFMEKALRQDRIAMEKFVERMGAAGYPLDYDAILRNAVNKITFPSLAVAMAAAGYVTDRYEARKLVGTLYREVKPSLPRVDLPSGTETIRFIRSIGAVPVLAHPYLNFTEEQLPRFLKQAVEAGLKGMETLYHSYSEETTAKAQRIARAFGLLPSGGSDFHGATRPATKLGVGKGNLAVPDSYYFDLQKESRNG